jgi:hypothetical protein
MTLTFVPASAPPSDGLVAMNAFGRWRYLFADSGTWRSVPRDVAVYLELAKLKRTAIRWSPREGGQLTVQHGAPLPLLHARAATLCYGILPSPELQAGLLYNNVPFDIASRICRALKQPEPKQPEDQPRAR